MHRRLWLTTGALLIALEAVLPPVQLAAVARGAHARLVGGQHDAFGDAATCGLTTLVGCAAWLGVGWLSLLCLLDLASAAPGRCGRCAARVRRTLTPGLVARALCSGLAAGTTLATVAPAIAAPAVQAVAPCAADPLPNLDRPAPPPPCAPSTPSTPVIPTPTGRATDVGRVAVVRPGDTLWGLAAAELRASSGTPPNPSAIAARWPAWWQANREEIGADPAFLVPGEHLRVPAGAPQPDPAH